MDAELIIGAIGRVLFTLMLVLGGVNHFTKSADMAAYAAHKKVPSPKLANLVSGLLLVLGGLSVLLGVYADLGAILAAVVLLAMAVFMHNFWTQTDAQAKQTEMISFMKNVSMAGGALVMLAALLATAKTDRVIGPMLTDSLFGK